MTPELLEFRKWNVVAGLVEKMSDNQLEPVVLNFDAITLLVIWLDKAFFFSSYPDGQIAVDTWNADTDELIDTDWLFPPPMRDAVTFREIAHAIMTKILT